MRYLFALIAIVLFFIAVCVAMEWGTFKHSPALMPSGFLFLTLALFSPRGWRWEPLT